MLRIYKLLLVISICVTSEYTWAYSGGNGSIADPFQISTVADIIELSNSLEDWDNHFIQTEDITFDSDYNSVDWDGDGSTVGYGAAGFIPIGTDADSRRFTGSYKGVDNGVDRNSQLRTITNLYINRPSSDDIGLFGTTKGADISYIGLKNASITGGQNTGGLIGKAIANEDTSTPTIISNCYVEGEITGGEESDQEVATLLDGDNTGGFVGTIINSTITNSHSKVTILGKGEQVGGFVGYAQEATINSCFTESTVSGYNVFVGGFAGQINETTITNSYSNGSASNIIDSQGDKTTIMDKIGGFVGHVNTNSTITGSYSTTSVNCGDDYYGGFIGVSTGDGIIIDNCYATGTVGGDYYGGGFIGLENSGTTISNSYASGVVFSYRYDGGEIRTFVGRRLGTISNCYGDYSTQCNNSTSGNYTKNFSEFIDGSSIANLDNTTWVNSNDYLRPYLIWESGTTTAAISNGNVVNNTLALNTTAPNGTSVSLRYRESEELEWIDLATTVSVNGGAAYINLLNDLLGTLEDNKEYIIQPYVTLADNNFYGDAILLHLNKYSGGDGTESSPFIIASMADLISLSQSPEDWANNYYFSQTADIDFTTNPESIDWDNDGELEHELNGDDYYGFRPIGSSINYFIGNYEGNGHTISNLYIYYNKHNYNGLFGRALNSKISNLKLVDEVIQISGNYPYTGGLIGYISGSSVDGNSRIENCTVSANIKTSYSYTGGLVGTVNSTAVVNCHTEGVVSGGETGDYVGGLAGRVEYNQAKIENCSSSASVSGDRVIGGLIASSNAYNTNYKNSYSTGVVSGNYGVGGFWGWTSNGAAIVNNCYSTGAVISKEIAGGFAAGFSGQSNGTVKFTNCYATGEIVPIYGNELAGGFVGSVVAYTNTYTDCFIDFETAGTEIKGGYSHTGNFSQVTNLSSSDFTSSTNFTNYDNSIWSFDSSGRPYLSWQTNNVSNSASTYSNGEITIDGSSTGTVNGYGIRYATLEEAIAGNWNYKTLTSLATSVNVGLLDSDNLVQPYIINASGDKIYGDMTLLKIPHTLHFEDGVEGETITIPSDETLNRDDIRIFTEEPSRSGYTFAGWLSDSEEIYKKDDTLVMPESDLNLTALWSYDGGYKLIYDLDYEGAPAAPLDDDYYTPDSRVDIDVPEPERSGYEFAGWVTSDIDGTENIFMTDDYLTMPNNFVFLKASWSKYYTITYDGNGYTYGTLPEGKESVSGINYAVYDSNISFKKKNYTFNGWYATYINSSGDRAYPYGSGPTGMNSNNDFTIPKGDVTIKAQWVALETYTLTINDGNSSVTSSEEAAGNRVELTTPTRSGYQFAGWSDGNTIYRDGTTFTMPDEEVTLTAQWSSDGNWMVLYSGEGTENLSSNEYSDGDDVTASSAPLHPLDYLFVGWETYDISGSRQILQAGESFRMGTTHITLKAVWSSRVSVTYNAAEYGLFDDNTTVRTFTNLESGDDVPDSPTLDVISGYEFVEWIRVSGQEFKAATEENPAQVGESNLEYIAQYRLLSSDPSTVYIGELAFTEAERDTLLAAETFIMNAAVAMSSDNIVHNNATIRFRFPKQYISTPYIKTDGSINGFATLQGTDIDPELYFEGDEAIVEYRLESLSGASDYIIPAMFSFQCYSYKISSGVATGNYGTLDGYTATVRLEIADENENILQASSIDITNKNHELELRKYMIGGGESYQSGDNRVKNMGVQDPFNEGYLAADNKNQLIFRYNLCWIPYKINFNYGRVSYRDVVITENLPDVAKFDPDLNPHWRHLGDGVPNGDGSYMGGTVTYDVMDDYLYRESYSYNSPYSIVDADLTLTYPGAKMHVDPGPDDSGTEISRYTNAIKESEPLTLPYVNSTTITGREFDESEVRELTNDDITYFIKEHQQPEGAFYKHGGRNLNRSDDGYVVSDSFYEKNSADWGYVLSASSSTSIDWEMENIIMEDYGMDITHFKFHSLGVFYDGEGEFKGTATLEYTEDGVNWEVLTSSATSMPLVATGRNTETVPTNYILPDGVDALKVRFKSNSGSYLEAASTVYLVIDADIREEFLTGTLSTEEAKQYTDSNNKLTQRWYYNSGDQYIYSYNYAAYHSEWKDQIGSLRNTYTATTGDEFGYQIENGGDTYNAHVKKRNVKIRPYYISPSVGIDTNTSNEIFQEITTSKTYFQMGKVDQLDNMMVYIQLPKGMVFTGDGIEITPYANYYQHSDIDARDLTDDSWYQIVDDWRGEGRQTLVANLGAYKSYILGTNSRNYLHYDVMALPEIRPDANYQCEIDVYITTDDHYALTWSSSYTDETPFDSDGYGDNKEGNDYCHRTADYTIIIPQEVYGLLYSKGEIDDVYKHKPLASTTNIAGDIDYKLTITNGKVSQPVTEVEIINVLPYINDMSILPGEGGSFDSRESTTNVILAGPVEPLSGYTYFYSVEQGKEDFDAFSTATWYTQSQIEGDLNLRWEDMKSIKVVGDITAEIAAGESINFIYPAKGEADYTIDHNDKANNSFAFTHADAGGRWSESTLTTTLFTDYEISGYAFVDTDGDNQKDGNEYIAGHSVDVERRNSDNVWEVALNAYGNSYKTATEANGYYKIDVHEPGEYRMIFDSKEGHDIVDYFEVDEDNNPIKSNLSYNNGPFYSSDNVILSPSNEQIYINGGFIASTTYRLFYKDGVEGEEITVPTNPHHYAEGRVVILDEMTPQRTNYIFTGWVDQNDNNKSYPASGTLVMPGADVTLTAQWRTEDEYRVLYDGNGNDGGVVPTDNVNYETDAQANVKPELPTRTNHTFEGWLYKGVIYSSTDQLPLPETGLDILLVAQWKPQYRVFYVDGVSNDEIAVPTDDNLYYEDDNVTISSIEPTRSNYEFGGWSYKNNLYSASGNFTMPGEDVTLTATWITIDKYRLFYDGNGADIATVPVNSGTYFEGDEIVVADQEPSRSGYRFDGWLYDGDIYQPWLPVYIPDPGEDITLVAQWTPLYNVIYDINGGDQETEPVDNQDYLAGTTAPVSGQTPTRSDALSNPTHRFAGWLDADTGQLHSISGSVLMPPADVTLVAQWNEINKYAVLYDGNGNDGGVVPVDNIDYDAGVIASVEDGLPTRSGFEFNGWLSDEDIPMRYQGGNSNSESFTMPPRNITLTAQWKPLYTITYLGGGSGATDIPIDNAGPYAEGTTASVSLDIPSRFSLSGTEYDFLYWRDEDGNQYGSGANLTMPDHDVVLTAFWLLQGDNRYKVIYDGNGANIGTTPIDPSLYDSGVAVDILEEMPIRDGYTFLEWKDSETGAVYSGGLLTDGESFTMPNENVLLVASWEIIKYKVTYDDGVDDSSVNNMPTQLVHSDLIYNSNFELAQDASPSGNNTIPQRPGFHFAGWQIDVSTTNLNAGDIIHTEIDIDRAKDLYIPNSDVILTAQWKRVFTVTYNQNAPDGEVSNMPTSLTSDVAEGYLYILNQNSNSKNTIPTRPGYFFGGWQIDVSTSNYESEEVVHTEVNLDLPSTFYMPESNVILTAQWGGSISGIAFLDNNDDGKYGDDDTTLSAVTASLQKHNGTIWESTGTEVTTTTNGYYAFNELSDGSYRIIFTKDNDQNVLIDYTAWAGNLTEPTSNAQKLISGITSDQFDISETTSSYEMGLGYKDGCLIYMDEIESGGIYLVQSAADLICLSNHPFYWDKNCYQTEDCNFLESSQLGSLWSDKNSDSEVQDDEIDFNMDGDFSNDEDGFNPIGVGFGISPFTGHYIGYNLTTGVEIIRSIRNLYIDTPDHNTLVDESLDGSYAALFGSVQESTIKNVLLIDPDVTGENYVGAMIGYGNEVTETSNCHTVEGSVVATGDYCGGFTGYYFGYVDSSSSSSDVTGRHYVGGFAGINATSLAGGDLVDQIISCYSTGFVYSTSTETELNIGGFVGTNANGIVDCYATGAVQVSNINGTNIGGFCGSNDLFKEIASSYASGDISQAGGSSGSRNAFVGTIFGPSALSGNYFDANTTAATDLATGVASTSTDNFKSLNLGGNWTQDGNSYGRPHLSWQSDNVSNPIPDYIYNGFSQEIGGVSSVENSGGSRIYGLRYRAVDLSSDWQNLDNRSSAPIELVGLSDDKLYYIQPFIYRADGLKEFGDMVVVNITAVSTLFIDGILDRSANFHGSVDAGSNIEEYGFVYSHTKNEISTLQYGESEVQSISTESNLSPLKSAAEIGEYLKSSITIDLRSNCYVRAYIKMPNGGYNYGEIVRFISEQRDFSLSLDGNSSLIADATSTTETINNWGASNQFSIDFWVKGEAISTVQTLISNSENSNGYKIDITADGKLELAAGVASITSTATITDNQWHHIGLAYSGSDMDTYIDGKLDNTQSIAITKPVASSSSNLTIGSGVSLTTPFTGNIDALRFWNTTLSQEQTEAIAYDNLTGVDNGLVTMIGSEKEVAGLNWNSLTASFGFNVKSTKESTNNTTPSSYSDRNSLTEYSFFHEDSRLSKEYTDYATYLDANLSFNLITVGDAKPSVELPRVNWRVNSGTNDWLTSSNWSSYAYPGEGVASSNLDLYKDVTTTVISDLYSNSLFTIINGSLNQHPATLYGFTTIDILVDIESSIKSYRVDNIGRLTIMSEIISKMWDLNIVNRGSAKIIVESGSIEVHK